MTTSALSIAAPDLSRRAPRSLRIRLGGYAHLPRLLDKFRAHIAGQIGEYHFNCPIDQQLLAFIGLDAEKVKAAVATGQGDGEMLEWIQSHAGPQRAAWEIEAWSAWMTSRCPASDPGTAGFFASALAKLSSTRTDIHTWADLLDLDDHCSFGGKS